MPFAQDPEKTKLDFGIKGGVNVAGIEGDYAKSIQASYKVTLHGGVFVSYPLVKDKLRLQMDLLVSGKGYKADVEDSILLTSIVQNMFYLDIPFYAQFFTGKGWELHGGVQYSLLLGEQYVNFAPSRKAKMSVSDSDFGVLLGGAYKIDMRNKVGARYIYGLNNIINFDGLDSHSSLFQFYIAFTII